MAIFRVLLFSSLFYLISDKCILIKNNDLFANFPLIIIWVITIWIHPKEKWRIVVNIKRNVSWLESQMPAWVIKSTKEKVQHFKVLWNWKWIIFLMSNWWLSWHFNFILGLAFYLNQIDLLESPLPIEVIEKVMSYLSGEDLLNLATVGSQRLKSCSYRILGKKPRSEYILPFECLLYKIIHFILITWNH